MTTYPRVLHVGFNPIGSPTNTGLTLASMFGAWPRDELFQLYTMSRQEFVAGERAVVAPPSSAPVDGLARRVLGSRLPAPVTDGLNNSVNRQGMHTPWRVRARLAATTLNDIGPVWTGGRWVREIEAWRPDVIHSLLGGVRITRLVLSLSKRLDIPMVPHFMDDWLATLFTGGQLWGLPRREVDRLADAVLERSPLCLTIGKDMQEEYTRRLGRECVVVGNSVDFDSFSNLGAGPPPDPHTKRLRYIGGLHLGRAEVLRDIGRCLADRGEQWRLTISVPRSDVGVAVALAAQVPAIEVGDTLAPADVPATLAAADALLFVESSDPGIAAFTRLSVSTKVPEYLAAGRQVLAVGPSDQASVRALVRCGGAHYAGDGSSADQIGRALDSLSAAVAAGNTLRAADASARLEFGTAATQDRLRDALTRAADSAGVPG